jgi:hypothetical protein
MPQRDNDGTFDAAVIATEGRPNSFVECSDHCDWLINQFVDLSAVSFVAHVKPYPRYGDAIQAKYGKMDVMARLYRLFAVSDIRTRRRYDLSCTSRSRQGPKGGSYEIPGGSQSRECSPRDPC